MQPCSRCDAGVRKLAASKQGFGGSARFDDPPTEIRGVGSEDWVYLNLTADTHPIHLHLTTSQVIGRTPFDAEACVARYAGARGVPGSIDLRPMRPLCDRADGAAVSE